MRLDWEVIRIQSPPWLAHASGLSHPPTTRGTPPTSYPNSNPWPTRFWKWQKASPIDLICVLLLSLLHHSYPQHVIMHWLQSTTSTFTTRNVICVKHWICQGL
eukprot:PhF_6_TR40479/c0_g1_i3/m.60524